MPSFFRKVYLQLRYTEETLTLPQKVHGKTSQNKFQYFLSYLPQGTVVDLIVVIDKDLLALADISNWGDAENEAESRVIKDVELRVRLERMTNLREWKVSR